MSTNYTASRKQIRNLKAVTTLSTLNKTAFVFKIFLGRAGCLSKIWGSGSAIALKCGARRKSRVNTKSVSPAKRRDAFSRDHHKCTNCGSTKNLEVDHIKPQALGGKDELDNLQTLCRNCNQRRAIKTFSLEKIKSFR